MKTLRTAGFALLLAAATATAAVDPALLNLVMPDAKVITGIQVSQTLASPFGQYVLSQMQPGDQNFQDFLTATGFDPRHDLQQIVVATGDPSVTPHNALLLGRGTFTLSQINTAATAHGATVAQYHGVNIYTAPNQKSQGSIAFPDQTTAMIGDIAAVQAAIDRYLAHATLSGDLASQAQAVSAANQAWFATTSALSEFLSGKLGNSNLGNVNSSNLMQSVLQATGGISFTASGITITSDAVTASPQNAQSLVDVLKFIVGMIQSNAKDANVSSIANNAIFTVNGSTAHISVPIAEQTAEQLFMPHMAAHVRRPAAVKQ